MDPLSTKNRHTHASTSRLPGSSTAMAITSSRVSCASLALLLANTTGACVGMADGCADPSTGRDEGAPEGSALGSTDASAEGATELGRLVGVAEGAFVSPGRVGAAVTGDWLGSRDALGERDGRAEGVLLEGLAVGASDGVTVDGSAEGAAEGEAEGAVDGDEVLVAEGAIVSPAEEGRLDEGAAVGGAVEGWAEGSIDGRALGAGEGAGEGRCEGGAVHKGSGPYAATGTARHAGTQPPRFGHPADDTPLSLHTVRVDSLDSAQRDAGTEPPRRFASSRSVLSGAACDSEEGIGPVKELPFNLKAVRADNPPSDKDMVPVSA